jgi:glycosyltransferase involved in cell wall biosynthesis
LLGLGAISDVEPHVIAFDTAIGEPESAVIDGHVPVTYVPGAQRFGNVTFHRRDRAALRKVLDDLRPDLVHAQDATRHGYISLKAERRVPVVVSIHGLVREELRYVDGLASRLRVRLAGVAMERYCVRNARLLLAPTRYAEQVYGSELAGRLRDVGNPISERFFGITPAPEPARILYSGAVIRRKRLLDLIDALPEVAEAVPTASLRVTGGAADPEYASEVRHRVRDRGLGERVVFLGGLSFGDLLEEFRRASILVLPSGEETSPMVIGEAMAASLPVVATRVGGVASLVDDGVTGHIVEVGDVAALAACITSVLVHADRARALGAAGREKADRAFRPAAVAARVRAAYDEALAGAAATE